MSVTTTRVLVDDIDFGEGPRWHEGRFWFSDIAGRRVYRISEDGELETIAVVEGQPSGLGWRPDGTLLIVSMLDHRLLALVEGALEEVADLSEWCGGHLNDMVVDDRGRAYIGNIGFDLEAQPLVVEPTHLVRVDPDGSARSVADELIAPNGMVITPDGSTLIVGESGGARLTAFDVAEDGSLSGRRVWADLPGGAVPDGICLDAEGAVWVASPTTHEFIRVREGGEVAQRIPTAERVAIACMLGGPERRTLYLVTSATSSLKEAASLRAGRIETVEVEVPGAGRP